METKWFKRLSTDKKLELDECNQLEEVLGRLPSFDPPPDLVDAVMSEVNRLESGKKVALFSRLRHWWSDARPRWEKALNSEYWNPMINLITSIAAVLLFFTEWGKYSVINQLLYLTRSGDKLATLSQSAINDRAIQDLLWNIKVGVEGLYYSFLTYWIN